ncbi:MAG: hypothetical protein COU65_03480 [Candidatus Pacebacteria bacterium CG10_big_fil_rev_8_21_14_0_10_42_12]|nr:MAG: hypothetical protein COU65_03480 [Candidatus Pacebacteria bacterium CG10_big_fil_rev_8_21_14_0_10_42_12]
MENLFLLIFLLTPFALATGLIKPGLFKVLFGGNVPQRSLLLKIFIPIFIGSFVGFGITSDAKTTSKSDQTDEETVAQSVTEVIPLPEIPDVVVSDIDQEETEPENTYIVTSVADGDTVTLNNGWKVRYIGIDTPEMKHPTKPKGCMADEAKARNEELVLNKEVLLEKDVSDLDIYDRHLAYVYVDNQMVNLTLMKEGLAESNKYPPDTKNQQIFDEAEKEAKEQRLGIWSSVCDSWLATPSPSPISSPITKSSNSGTGGVTAPAVAPIVAPVNNTEPPSSQYTCSCSKTCGNMSSCEEAYFQLNTCGCSARDGDDDGVPCESLCR